MKAGPPSISFPDFHQLGWRPIRLKAAPSGRPGRRIAFAPADPMKTPSTPPRTAERPARGANGAEAGTPMMRQFNALKEAYPDCILLFRSGDFYEMFGEDARRASEALQIALTTRNKGTENEVPMCGVPYHAYEQYLNRLTAQGFKVAIAEQMEDPATAKGLVRREVVRVVTPGTTVSGALLEGDQHRYIVAIEPRHGGEPTGLALADLSTGLFEVVEFAAAERERLWDFLLLEQPREVLVPKGRSPKEQEAAAAFLAELARRFKGSPGGEPRVESAPSAWFDPAQAARLLTQHFQVASLAGFGVEEMPAAVAAAGALLAFLRDTQKSGLHHITQLRARNLGQRMRLDDATTQHLELFENRMHGAARHTLFGVLNLTRTPMGARLLRDWLGAPLLDAQAIGRRLDGVAELADRAPSREALRLVFARIRDLERTVARISLPVAGIADIVALREALAAVQLLPPLVAELHAPLLQDLTRELDPLEDVYLYLKDRFLEEPSLRVSEGGYIAAGVAPELDTLRELSRTSKDVLAGLEARERERTGIGSLKIRYNRVFGYYLEVTRAHQAKVPPGWQRKQTLVNAERYTTPELQEIEDKLLSAEERIQELEQAEFERARAILGGYARRMQRTARAIAELDTLAAFAQAAREYGYVRPTVLPTALPTVLPTALPAALPSPPPNSLPPISLPPNSVPTARPAAAPRRLDIRAGRHPVIERIALDEPFVPNDVRLDSDDQRILLITGPNMAGKSTVMRQVALIQLMAQAGSFVPADFAELSVVDRLFTRVGAADNLSKGQSTFLLEMIEAANILNHASANSLVILDEIGRGTSTFDGISIAWAMVEHLHEVGALTMFATHYHELTQLALELKHVRNYNVSIVEDGDRLAFTRKLVPGEADKSYGIQVARLAGLPPAVVSRAHEVMDALVNTGGLPAGRPGTAPRGRKPRSRAGTGPESKRAEGQLSMLPERSTYGAVHPVLDELKALDVEHLTPLEALNLVARLKARLTSEES
jgi:DNA mismatch repair protein MutS